MHYGKTVVIGLITEIAPEYWVVRIHPMDTLHCAEVYLQDKVE